MVYAADKIVQMPVMQLYDTGLMQSAIQNARYMYEKAEKRMDDFYEKYGEFMSPFQKDMDRYQQIVGDVRKGIDQLYASGEDPLRTASGRAKMAQLIRSVDPAEMSRMRANAKMGYEYLKDIEQARAKNEFNEDYENFLLSQPGGPGRFQDFSSANGAMWTRSAAGRYSDLNQYTGHIFDKMADSFIGTGPDHYDYYGVTRADRAKALTQHLSGLLQNPLGRFHYENSKAAAERVLGRPISDQEAMQIWQNDILDATHEYDHQNRKLNEMWKMRQENAARRAASVSTTPTNTPQWGFMEHLRRNTASRAAGLSVNDWGIDGKKVLSVLRDKQIQRGKEISKAAGNVSGSAKGQQMFVDAYETTHYDPSAIVAFLVSQSYSEKGGGDVLQRYQVVDNNTIRMKAEDAYRLFGRHDVVSHTTGYRGRALSTDRSKFNDAEYIDVTFSGGVYGAYTKRDRNENYFRISKITTYKPNGAAGQDLYDSNGNLNPDAWVSTQLKGGDKMYFDSHITSEKDNPGTGSLGTYDKKKKGVRDMRGIPVTNTHDQGYQDAVQGDIVMSKILTQGTDYDTSATIPEVLGFGVTTTK